MPQPAMLPLQRLTRGAAADERWQAWLAESGALAAEILERRGGELLDVGALWQETRADLEARDGRPTGG